ncbi:MAG: hypothetical protein HDQ88_10470 [Clostridia bacterium]|nr:hypothetical protein [Clostridia bacterium]
MEYASGDRVQILKPAIGVEGSTRDLVGTIGVVCGVKYGAVQVRCVNKQALYFSLDAVLRVGTEPAKKSEIKSKPLLEPEVVTFGMMDSQGLW